MQRGRAPRRRRQSTARRAGGVEDVGDEARALLERIQLQYPANRPWMHTVPVRPVHDDLPVRSILAQNEGDAGVHGEARPVAATQARAATLLGGESTPVPGGRAFAIQRDEAHGVVAVRAGAAYHETLGERDLIDALGALRGWQDGEDGEGIDIIARSRPSQGAWGDEGEQGSDREQGADARDAQKERQERARALCEAAAQEQGHGPGGGQEQQDGRGPRHGRPGAQGVLEDVLTAAVDEALGRRDVPALRIQEQGEEKDQREGAER